MVGIFLLVNGPLAGETKKTPEPSAPAAPAAQSPASSASKTPVTAGAAVVEDGEVPEGVEGEPANLPGQMDTEAPGEGEDAGEAAGEKARPGDGSRRFTPVEAPTLGALYLSLPRYGHEIFASATSAEPVVNAPVPPNYLVGPGDVLELKVWAANREQVNQELIVSPEGLVVVPQLGRQTLSGRTVEQVRQALSDGYRQFYAEPVVTLVISEQRVIDVYVTGDAMRPGKYSLNGMATLFTALFAAGGPTAIGSYREVRLLRLGQPALSVDLYDYLLHGQREADPLLQPGDTIFIPPLQTQVGLAGEVRRPRLYEIKPGEKVGEALAMAGGLEPTAYAQGVRHWRVEEDGKWHLTALKLAPGSPDLQRSLKDGDLLEVAEVLAEPENTVAVLGAVQRPGHYPVIPGLTIAQAIQAAEGLQRHAYLGIAVHRRLKDDTDYEVRSFDLRQIMGPNKTGDIFLQAKDIVQIFSQEELTAAPQVEVQGEVFQPGQYEWNEGLRVSDLMQLAGGAKAGAYLPRADIIRRGDDQKLEIIPVALARALAGEVSENLLLRRDDVLTVRDEASVLGAAEVHITGYVRSPGIYPRRKGMRVSDLLFQAGGLLPNAHSVLEYSRGRQPDEPVVLTLQVLERNGEARIEPDLLLEDDDTVAVKANGDMGLVANTCTLSGQVCRPGSYILKNHGQDHKYTVWELLQEAGMFLPDANLDGLVLYRPLDQRMGKAQEEDLGNIVRSLNKEQAQGAGAMNIEAQKAAMTSQVNIQLASVFERGSKVTIVQPPIPVSTTNWVSAVPLEGRKLVATQGTEGNIDLQPGDMVVVPRVSDTVLVLGAVVRAGATPHVENQTMHYYVGQAGGGRDDASLNRVVVIRANGSAIRWQQGVEIRAGDVLVVPSEYLIRSVRAEPTWETWLKNIAAVATSAIIAR